MKSRIALIVALCAVLLMPLSLHAQTAGQNLLVDGDFEASPWPLQDGLGGVQVAPSWRAWYVENAPSYVKMPVTCDKPTRTDCYWMRPEFHEVQVGVYPNRIHSGIRAQQYYSYGRMHEGGLYQRVTGVPANSTLSFSIFIQAWQCANSDSCGKNGIRSDAPADMHLRVGIDPYGGADPFSSNIVWSSEKPAFDQWVEFSVRAQAHGDTVTVFTHSRAEWDWPRINNDVYLDDASLVVAGAAQAGTLTTTQAAVTQVPGTLHAAGTPTATRTPRPDGSVVHIVQAGDTLSSIALQSGVTVDDLLRLNNLTRTAVLSIGQEIVVKVGTGTVVAQVTRSTQATQTATATVQVTKPAATPTTFTSPLTPTVSPTPTRVPPTATSIPEGLCLSAFDDLNNNTLWDGNEPGLAGVTFVVSAGGKEVARYASDGSGRPNCLTQLPPAAYSVEIIPPAGYVVALEKADVALALGQQVDLTVAARHGEKATPTVLPPTPTETPTPVVQPMAIRSTATAIVIVILVVLFLALVAISAAVIRRRRLL